MVNKGNNKMTNDFYTRHKETINHAINSKTVRYSMGDKATANITIHCYYVDDKNTSIVVYAKYDKTTRSITKYTATVTVDNEQQKDSEKIAKDLYAKLSAVYDAQIARTCLKNNFNNAAFRKKR